MCQNWLVFALLAGILWTLSEGLTPFRKCTEDIPAPQVVQFNDCEGHPCILKAGTSANITVQFTAVNKTQTVMAQIIVYVNGDAMPIYIPEDEANVCNHLINDSKCPLNAGDNATYSVTLPIDRGLPDIFAATEIALVDDQGECMTCFVTDIRVQSRNNPGPTEEKGSSMNA